MVRNLILETSIEFTLIIVNFLITAPILHESSYRVPGNIYKAKYLMNWLELGRSFVLKWLFSIILINCFKIKIFKKKPIDGFE